MPDLEQRLAAIESRLKRIESALNIAPEPAPVEKTARGLSSAAPTVETFTFEKRPPTAPPQRPQPNKVFPGVLSITNILGWGGAAALVLAAAYLIKLVIDWGWLTPGRQIGLAVVGAATLIGAGLALRKADRQYAGLLPATGIVILFLAVYGAHLYYGLIGSTLAGAAVIAVCLASLGLWRIFASELYVLFAVAGSYSAPFLLPPLRRDLIDLAIYYSAWSLLYSFLALAAGKRRIYLLALYLALIGFDLTWYIGPERQWVAALLFQCGQFLIFAGGALLFSLRHRAPLTRDEAWAHLPALLLFYFLQYSILDRHLPAWAPWISMASAALLLAGYLATRRLLRGDSDGGQLLLGCYCALVVVHAGYLEAVPEPWQPWVALLVLPGLAIYGLIRRRWSPAIGPLAGAGLLVFAANYLRLLSHSQLARVPGHSLLVLLYPLQLYAGYFLWQRTGRKAEGSVVLLYAGHLAAMAAIVHDFDSRFAVSIGWGLLALACLGLALKLRHKALGQSSLLIFAASAAKVLLYDLAGAAPLVRIACLLVLGTTCYAGGWLYRRVGALQDAPGP
jgi:uncharacterized membrane protein